jgi:hypothetical protein
LKNLLFVQAETEAAMKQAESATRAAETLLKGEGTGSNVKKELIDCTSFVFFSRPRLFCPIFNSKNRPVLTQIIVEAVMLFYCS